jgi:hypothetical protein
MRLYTTIGNKGFAIPGQGVACLFVRFVAGLIFLHGADYFCFATGFLRASTRYRPTPTGTRKVRA